jgi:hypothetical protein
VQKKLSEESSTIREYLAKTRLTAEKVAKIHGFSLSYAQIPAPAVLHHAKTTDTY